MENNKFIEQGNVSIIDEVCYPGSKIPMIRYETLVDFLANEPALIHLFEESDKNKLICEPIFKLFVDVPNNYFIAYTFYCDKREDFTEDSCVVVRRIIWEKAKDIKQLKQFPEKREEFLKSWPTIKSQNIVFLNRNNILKMLKELDGSIKNGIFLEERDKTYLPIWNDLEIMRRYNWGEIRGSWGHSMQNSQIEQQIIKMIDNIETEFEKKQPVVYKIELDYRFPIDLYRSILLG